MKIKQENGNLGDKKMEDHTFLGIKISNGGDGYDANYVFYGVPITELTIPQYNNSEHAIIECLPETCDVLIIIEQKRSEIIESMKKLSYSLVIVTHWDKEYTVFSEIHQLINISWSSIESLIEFLNTVTKDNKLSFKKILESNLFSKHLLMSW